MGKNWRQSRRARKRQAMRRALEGEGKSNAPGATPALPALPEAGKKKPRPRQTRRRRGEASGDW